MCQTVSSGHGRLTLGFTGARELHWGGGGCAPIGAVSGCGADGGPDGAKSIFLYGTIRADSVWPAPEGLIADSSPSSWVSWMPGVFLCFQGTGPCETSVLTTLVPLPCLKDLGTS